MTEKTDDEQEIIAELEADGLSKKRRLAGGGLELEA